MMKHFKKLVALVITLVIIIGTMSMLVFAEEGGGNQEEPTTSTPSITITAASTAAEGATDTTEYTWYRIFEAEITEDPTQDGASQNGGKVAYYVDSQEKATEIEETGLFNVVRVGNTDKWYVELKNKEHTSAEDLVNAFSSNTFNLSVFPNGTFAQNAIGGTATSGDVAPGYYYITSSAGKNVVIQTLTAVTIEEKNVFPTTDKKVDATDVNAQIGDEINYTLEVVIPASANDVIVLTDEMDAALTFKSIDDKFSENVAYTFYPAEKTPAAVTDNDNKFKLTIAKDDVIANRNKTLTIHYIAVLNNKAVVGTPVKNKVTLDYGTHYTSTPKETTTNTYSFDFNKVDADGTTMLTGAEFKLTLENTVDGAPIDLVEVEAGKTYRVRMSEDIANAVTTITTNGNTVTINGLDTDVTYYLVETKAPTGYNKLGSPVEIKADHDQHTFLPKNIENNKGSVLPATGGIGTTIFYIIGAVLVLGAGILLVTRRRMDDK